jgi:hypothetical protein
MSSNGQDAFLVDHELCRRYGLDAKEILDAIDGRFRLRVAVEGAIAEAQAERHIRALVGRGIERYEMHDEDGKHDFTIWIRGRKKPLRVECKNVRNSNEAFRSGGEIVAYKVETQKTRAAKGDHTSRFYDVDQFDILAVCLGKKTGDWRDMMFVRTLHLTRQTALPNKLAAIQRVPLPTAKDIAPWSRDLGTLLAGLAR